MLSARVFARRVASNALNKSLFAPQVIKPTLTTQRFFAGTFLNSADVTERIVSVVKNFDKVDPDKVKPESKFSEDLGLDSLDNVEVVMAIEDEFAIEIPDAEADKIASVADAVEYIVGHPMAK